MCEGNDGEGISCARDGLMVIENDGNADEFMARKCHKRVRLLIVAIVIIMSFERSILTLQLDVKILAYMLNYNNMYR